jgi:hypothetical protein
LHGALALKREEEPVGRLLAYDRSLSARVAEKDTGDEADVDAIHIDQPQATRRSGRAGKPGRTSETRGAGRPRLAHQALHGGRIDLSLLLLGVAGLTYQQDRGR